MKTRTKVILVIVAVILIGIVIGLVSMMNMVKEGQKVDLTVSEVDLSRARDGTYEGTCDAFPVFAKVEVTVNDSKITGIKLVEHRNGQGSAAEVLPSKVVKAQSLQVDTISGATMSSKVIRKAIENALSKAVG